MPRLLSDRCVYRRSALLNLGASLVLLLAPIYVVAQTGETAADLTALFQKARTTANQLNRDAAIMESYTRSRPSWTTHSAQIARIRTHINEAGSTLSQMQSARGGAKPWQQDAIDGITPALKELASNTESIINHLTENPRQLKDPTYMQYLRSNAQSASELASAVSNVVDYDRTRTRMEELQAKLEH